MLIDGIPFYALTTGAFGHDTNELTDLLFKFWEENGACDIAVSVGCPINTFITKQAAVRYTDLHQSIVFFCQLSHGCMRIHTSMNVWGLVLHGC